MTTDADDEKVMALPCGYQPCPNKRGRHQSGLCEEHAALFDFFMTMLQQVKVEGRPLLSIIATTAHAQNQMDRAMALQQAKANGAKLLNANGTMRR